MPPDYEDLVRRLKALIEQATRLREAAAELTRDLSSRLKTGKEGQAHHHRRAERRRKPREPRR